MFEITTTGVLDRLAHSSAVVTLSNLAATQYYVPLAPD